MTEKPLSFRELIDELPAPVWVSDPQGRVEWRNASAAQFSGLSLDDVTADTYVSIHPDDRPVLEAFLAEALVTAEPFETEFRSLRDGEYRWVVLQARPVRDRESRLLRWVAIVTDIDAGRRELTVLETMFAEVPAGLSFADPRVASRSHQPGWGSTASDAVEAFDRPYTCRGLARRLAGGRAVVPACPRER